MPKSPTPANADQMIYFVKADFGRLGMEWVGRPPASMDRKSTIEDIISGEFSAAPNTILECNPVEHICNDVTEDIAREVYAAIQDSGEACPAHLRDWLDIALGVSAADHLDISTGHFSVQRTAQRIRAAAE